MQVGNLFFSLGFKVTGSGELRNYEGAINNAQSAVERLQETFEEMAYFIEKMAISLGAVTYEEMDQHRADLFLLKSKKQVTEATKEQNKEARTEIGVLKQMHTGLSNAIGKFNAFRVEVVAVSAVIVAFTKKASDFAVSFDKIASATGISVEKIQRLSALAVESGASMDDLGGAIERFQQNSIDIMQGKGDISPYAFLGLDPHQDPIALLGKLQEKIKSLPAAMGTKAAKDLGLSDDLIYFLRNADQLKGPSEETIISEGEIKRLKEFNFYFNRVFEGVKRVMAKLGAMVAPVAKMILFAFNNMIEALGGFLRIMEPFQDKLLAGLKLIGAALIGLAALFFPITAAVVLFLLALEDLYRFIKGDDSLLGRFVNWFKDMGKWIDELTTKVMNFVSVFAKSPIATIMDKFSSWFKPEAPSAGGGAAAGGGGITNNNSITIDGAKNPEEIAKAVTDHVTKTTSDAYYQYAPGGF